ncbi:TolC family protein [Nitrospira sp. Kam-Ns4a]
MRRHRRLSHLTVVAAMLALSSGPPQHACGAEPSPQETLALSELIQEALAKNPEIQALRQQWEAATHRVVQASSLDAPTVQVQLWNVPQSFNVTQTQNSIFGVSQTFPFPGKLALRGEVASRSADMTEQALRAKERDLIARVKQAYYDLFLAHKAIEIHHEQVALLQQFVESAIARFRTGKGSQVDVLKAQVELSTLYQQLPGLEQRRDTAQAKVNTLLDRDPRVPLASPQAPRDQRFDRDLEELFQIAVEARPELKAGKLAIQRNERARALAQRQYYPDLQLAFQRFQNFNAPDGFGAVASITVPLAFWTKPKYDAAVREATAAVAAARAELHILENLTRFQIRDLLAKVRASWEMAVLYRTTLLPQAEQSVEAARAGYRTGKTSLLELIEADRGFREARLAYYRTLVDREASLAELEQVVGADL